MNTLWIQIGIGAWLLISPWILGFSSISVMKWNNVILGTVLVLWGVWGIFDNKNSEV